MCNMIERSNADERRPVQVDENVDDPSFSRTSLNDHKRHNITCEMI